MSPALALPGWYGLFVLLYYDYYPSNNGVYISQIIVTNSMPLKHVGE